jgi:Flp pilus assembly protein TadG
MTHPTVTDRVERGRDQRGSAAIWAMLLTAGAFTVLLGLVVDGGRVIDARLDSARVAGQAARTGADALSQAALRSGQDQVAAGAAIQRAQSYLRHTGAHGSVRVHGDAVTVTVTGRSHTRILGVIGIDSFPISEAKTARAVSKEEPP